jgi:outer membrane biogenesis lipoprotein LolB
MKTRALLAAFALALLAACAESPTDPSVQPTGANYGSSALGTGL